jgi:uncharacterized membrane protein
MQFIKKHAFWFVLGGAVLLSAALCLILAAQQQLWFDESYSIVVAERPLSDIVSLASVDAHPPFYYILLHFWGALVGWNELGLRALSIIFYATSIGLILLLISKLFSKKTAIYAAPVLILAPFLMRYGFEVRMYSLASLITVGSAFVLYYAMKTNKNRYWVIYGLLVALGVWTLYMTFVVFAAQFLMLVWRTFKKRDNWLKQKWILAYVGAVLLFVPWIPIAHDQMSGGALSGTNVTFGISQLLNVFSFGLLYETSDKLEFIYWLLLAMMTLATIVTAKNVLKSKKVDSSNFWFLAAHFLLPLALFMVIASPIFEWKIYLERYLAQFIIFGYASLAVIYASTVFANKKPSYYSWVALLLVLLIGTANLFEAGNLNYQRLDRPNNRDIALSISKYCDQAVVVDDLYFYIELAPYMASNCNYYFAAENEVGYGGGYAPLHGSDRRISDSAQIDTKQFVVVASTRRLNFEPSSNYMLSSSQDITWRRVMTYSRNQ